jgi:hypothetical protein
VRRDPGGDRCAKERLARGKGVDPERTFWNMLSSQAMAFNVFTPLARDPELATEIVAPLLPGVAAERIAREHDQVRALLARATPVLDATVGVNSLQLVDEMLELRGRRWSSPSSPASFAMCTRRRSAYRVPPGGRATP